jgi:hypothetical protein
MWTVQNVVGKLVEARLTKGDSNEVTACLTAIADAVARAAQPVVGLFDLSQIQVLGRAEADLLLKVMREDNARVERTAILVHGDALLEMQIERLIRAAALPSRQAFRLAGHAVRWLSPSLTPAELARLQLFLGV